GGNSLLRLTGRTPRKPGGHLDGRKAGTRRRWPTRSGVSVRRALGTSACARMSRGPERASFRPPSCETSRSPRRRLPRMTDGTGILSAIEQGDPHAATQLLPLVYDELRTLAAQKLAHEAPGQTLQATALVHEAYLRLVDVDKAQHWNSRGHFF